MHLDSKSQTKFAVTLDKINFLFQSVQQNGGILSEMDQTILKNYLKELGVLLETIQWVESGVKENLPVRETEQQNLLPVTSSKPESNISSKKTITESWAEKTKEVFSINDRLQRKREEVGDKLRMTPINNLSKYISLNKRFSFINTLFDGNSGNYDSTVKRLDVCSNYEEAVHYLEQHVASIYQWDANDELVSEFNTFVLRRFLK
jgi:hypothetical protein